MAIGMMDHIPDAVYWCQKMQYGPCYQNTVAVHFDLPGHYQGPSTEACLSSALLRWEQLPMRMPMETFKDIYYL